MSSLSGKLCPGHQEVACARIFNIRVLDDGCHGNVVWFLVLLIIECRNVLPHGGDPRG